MIRVVIIGVGNCASALVQGIQYYTINPEAKGLINTKIGNYLVSDIEVVGAIDVDSRKIGKDLSDAIFCSPNCARKFQEVPTSGVKVVKGPVLDGVAKHMVSHFVINENQVSVDVSKYLKEVNADFAICYLPVGSENAAYYYAQQSIDAGVGFINAIPVFICSTIQWNEKFKSAGVICAGDDIKSQFGATFINRIIVEALLNRGFCIEDLYQLNIGGNTDFLNMLDEERLESKRISKTNAIHSLFDNKTKNTPGLRIGPSDYVSHLLDTKVCYINVRGKQFGEVNFEIDIKLQVEDSPNSAGVMIDVIRLLKIAKDQGLVGNIEEISAFGFKHPIVNHTESVIPELISKYLRN